MTQRHLCAQVERVDHLHVVDGVVGGGDDGGSIDDRVSKRFKLVRVGRATFDPRRRRHAVDAGAQQVAELRGHWVPDVDRAALAVDARPRREQLRRQERALDLDRGRAIFGVEAAGEGTVDAGVAGDDDGGGVVDDEAAAGAGDSDEGAGDVDGVAAGVHEGAAGEVEVEADVVGLQERHTERRAHAVQASEAGDVVDDAVGEGVVAPMERLHQHLAARFRCVAHGASVIGVGRHRLLAEHVLAGLQRADRQRFVVAVGQRVVDGVDVVVGEEFVVGAVDVLDAVLAGEGAGAGDVARCDGGDDDVVDDLRRRQQRHRRDARGAEHADAQHAVAQHAHPATRACTRVLIFVVTSVGRVSSAWRSASSRIACSAVFIAGTPPVRKPAACITAPSSRGSLSVRPDKASSRAGGGFSTSSRT